jgi:Fur family transcriptional regulator, ferric uptake regulator
MPIPKEALAALRGNRYKLTPQRKAVLRILDSSSTHLTPAVVFEKVKKRNPRISLVTVYRTLNILVELGLACEIRTGANSKSYVLGNSVAHGHLICTNCGKVDNFEGYDISDLTRKLSGESGYDIKDHRLDLYGLCSVCASRKS